MAETLASSRAPAATDLMAAVVGTLGGMAAGVLVTVETPRYLAHVVVLVVEPAALV